MAACFSLAAKVAHAQSCHAPVLREVPEETSLRAALNLSFAGYDNAHGQGHYQGAALTLAASLAGLYAEVALPAYHITRSDENDTGLGDLAIGLRYAILGAHDSVLRLGPEVVATLPTGSAAAGLGMGHVMLMPGLFAALEWPSFFVLAQLAYGFALESDSSTHAQHHAGATHASGSIVDPMNAEELMHSLGASYEILAPLRVTARLFGALDTSQEGETREAIGLGGLVDVGLVDLAAELQLPIVGSPFSYRAIVSAALQW